ncbi:MAG: ion transporter [Spirochaetales bacterium]|nr:ion transporter [Spirochaetales bacterium]
MNKKITNFFEMLVVTAILLVLIQMFLEDFAVVSGWSMDIQKKLSISGFCFDLFFTIEFLTRLFYAVANKKTYYYLTRGRGWIDFFASVPLLMFNSGPTIFALFFSGTAILGIGGIFNVLKVIKTIRIARVLRFLRIIKIFGKIRYVDSVTAQRHIATVATISITVIVFSLFGASFITGSAGLPGIGESVFNHQITIAEALTKAETNEKDFINTINQLNRLDDTLLIVKKKGTAIYSRYKNGYYREHFGAGDYTYYKNQDLEMFFDSRAVSIQNSVRNLIFFFIILFTVAAFLIFYSPQFAITITDPLHVMERGFREKDYNLEVKIPEKYADDDVFRVAKLYNEHYLPLKDRAENNEEKGLLDIGMQDIKDILPD